MIALVPTDADLDRLALNPAVTGAEPRSDLHLTLWYLGEAADIPPDVQDGLVTAVRSMVERRDLPVVAAVVFGAALWNPDGDEPAWVLNVGDDPDATNEGLAVCREMMSEAWHDGMVLLELPEQHSPWQPHICLAYTADSILGDMTSRVGPVTFNRIRVAFGNNVTDVELTQPGGTAMDGMSAEQQNSVRAPDIDVVRALGACPALRSGSSDSLGIMTVPFSPFNTWYEVDSVWEGRFMERTVPGAFAKSLVADRDTLRSLFDHGMDPQVGNKVLGPIIDLRETDTSPVGEVSLLNTSYNRDLLPGLQARVYGSSFRMHVTGDVWDDNPKRSDTNPQGLPERTITQVKVREFGPVTFPANPAATASVRSGTDQFYSQLRNRDTSAYEAAARAAGYPNLTGRPSARSAGGGGSDPKATGSPSSSTFDDPTLRGGLLRSLGVL